MRVAIEGRRVEADLPRRQGRLLFAYLLLERHRGATRDELIELLWPQRPPPSARMTLRPLLSRLRATLGAEAQLDSSVLRIDFGEGAWIDVEAALASADRGERAIAAEAW